MYGIHSISETELHPFPTAGIRAEDGVLLGPLERAGFDPVIQGRLIREVVLAGSSARDCLFLAGTSE
jgi:hypothetical protein